jgi:flagellar basal body rod protein FlgG
LFPHEGSKPVATDFSLGHLIHTGRNLDLGLEGKGFFVVDTPEGPLYTRGGVFQLNARGQLVDFAGRTIAGEKGPIIVPSSASTSTLRVSRNGEVSADGKNLGKLKIVEFGTPQSLEAIGDCCFRAPEGLQQSKAVNTFVQQEYQEASNVSLVQEMVDLIKVSRMYEANAKSITTQDDSSKSLLRVATG